MYRVHIFLLFLTVPVIFSLENDTVPELRIIGGSYAGEGQFPYHVSIVVDGKFRCGGALISKRHVLTAAHCFIGQNGYFDAQNIKILIGHTSIKETSSAKIIIGVAKVYIPKAFSRSHDFYVIGDIAVLKLSGILKIPRNWLLSPPEQDKTYAGEMAIATGHGLNWKIAENPKDPRSRTSGSMDGLLRLIYVQIIDNQECARAYGRGDMSMSVVCAQTETRAHQAMSSLCDGDSGGPLVVDSVIVGVLSTGGPMCQADVPEVFTRVSSYVDFIHNSVHELKDPETVVIDMYESYQVD